MKEISVSLWELSRQEAKELPDGTQLLFFNTLANTYGVDTLDGRKCLCRNRNCSDYVKFFAFDAPGDIEGAKND